jgi:XTP/dITP diphosphohydrolase
VIALVIDGEEHLFEGVIKGIIIDEVRGGSGFGYDPVFVPEGYNQTFAELGDAVKNQISHRALATQRLTKFLTERESHHH